MRSTNSSSDSEKERNLDLRSYRDADQIIKACTITTTTTPLGPEGGSQHSTYIIAVVVVVVEVVAHFARAAACMRFCCTHLTRYHKSLDAFPLLFLGYR